MGLFTGLDEAALKGDVRLVRKALDKGADVNKPAKTLSKLHRRPLHATSLNGQVDMAELLIRRGAQVNVIDDVGQTPLHYVARTGYLELADVLLTNGADHTIRDRYGNLPIHVAIRFGQTQMQEKLRQHAVEKPLEVRFFEGGTWHPYDESAARAVSFELGEGSAYCALATSTGTTYIVDFRQQLQINANSLFAKSICWRIAPHGEWHYPHKPFQGLHAGSQDPRYLIQYEPLLRELRAQGLAPPPLHLQQPPLSADPFPPPASLVQYPQVAPSGRSSFFAAPVTPLPSSEHPPPQAASLARSYSQESSPGSSTRHDFLLDPLRPSAPVDDALRSSSAASADYADAPSTFAMATPIAAGSPGSSEDPDRPRFLNARPSAFKALRSGSLEFNEIVARFVRGMEKPPRRTHSPGLNAHGESPPPLRPVTVTCVYEVRAPPERSAAYQQALADRKAVRGNANERLAWHGAPFQSLEQIVLKGFKLNPQSRNGRLYGQGLYFAPEGRAYTSAEFALPDENGEKHMLFCRLIAGSIEAVPFESVQKRPSSSKYDTGVDNVDEPTRYVVWEDDVNEHVLPTHVVSFKYC